MAKKHDQSLPPPILLTAVPCDTVIVDVRTGKPSVIGLFEYIVPTGYPAKFSKFDVFCQLVNGHGYETIVLKILDVAEADNVIFEGTIEKEFKDPLEVANIIIEVVGVEFRHPGEYRLELSTKTAFLGERRIICGEPEGGEGEEDVQE